MSTALFQRAGVLALVLLPGALTVFFSFRSGGFFPGAPALVAAELAIVVAVRMAAARRPLEGLTPALAVAAAALGAFALWTFLSSGWSDAKGRALVEYDRALLYLLTLVLFGTVARTARRIRAMVYGLAGAIAAVCLTALAARLFPELGLHDAPVHPERLGYPLTYWNALGLISGIGAVLCGHLASSTREPRPARVLGAAAVPLLAATLYYTFSRGATWAALVGLIVYVIVGRPRGALSAAVATVPATLVALITVNPADVLTDAPASAAAIDAGREIALKLAACAFGAGLLRALLLPLDRRLDRLSLRVRHPRAVLAGASAAALCGLVLAALAAGAPQFVEDRVDEFKADRSVPGAGSSRLFKFGNNGRLEHWDVALQAYRAEGSRGHGAGTYELDWDRRRESSFTVDDAHSLYLEVLGELGPPGLIALAIVLLAILGAFAVRARGPDRTLYAALLAAGIAWCLHAAVDWDWEMPALTLWLFAFGGAALASAPRPARPRSWRARVLPATVALGCLALAVIPVRMALSQQRLDESLQALHDGDCAAATASARDADVILEDRPEPLQVVAFCALRDERPAEALRAMQEAARRDPENWELAYGLAVTRAAAGRDPRPAIRLAAQLNPLQPLVKQGVERLMGASRRQWRVRGAGAPLTLPD